VTRESSSSGLGLGWCIPSIQATVTPTTELARKPRKNRQINSSANTTVDCCRRRRRDRDIAFSQGDPYAYSSLHLKLKLEEERAPHRLAVPQGRLPFPMLQRLEHPPINLRVARRSSQDRRGAAVRSDLDLHAH